MLNKHSKIKCSVAITATLTFFVATVLCCCLGLVSPSEAKDMPMKSCHMHMAQKNHTAPSAKDCNDCPHKIRFLTLEKVNLDSPALSVLALLQIPLNTSLETSLDKLNSHFFSQGPPGKLASAVPLYIQHSVFRL